MVHSTLLIGFINHSDVHLLGKPHKSKNAELIGASLSKHYTRKLYTAYMPQVSLFHLQNQINNYKYSTKSTACYYATVHNTTVISVAIASPANFLGILLNNIMTLLNHNWKSTWSLD